MNIQLPRFSFLISACLLALSATAVEVRHNQLGMPFVLIPSGEFLMGINPRDLDTVLFEMETPDPLQLNDESPQHLVKISKAYWLGQTEVTQAQWLSVMHTRPGPAENWKQADWKLLPVVSTSWNMAQAFVTKLSKLDKKYNYRLPSEAEWEYAARAGSNELRPVAVDKLDEYAWSLKNSGDIPHPVATRKVSAFGTQSRKTLLSAVNAICGTA